jgi:hypothetical protein
MPTVDRVLLAPSQADVEEALREAVSAANAGTGRDRLALPPHGLHAGLARMESEGEGQLDWPTRRRAGAVRPGAGVAWWRDYLGRAHVRVIAAVSTASPLGPDWPALAAVYPGRVLVRWRDGRPAAALASCACGASGEPAALGWMGDVCGPCHDRGGAGQAPPAAPAAVGPFADVALAPDGSALATLSTEGAVEVRGLDGAPRAAFAAPGGPPERRALALGPGAGCSAWCGSRASATTCGPARRGAAPSPCWPWARRAASPTG